ncbi:MAG: DUF6036 family nucleotidyltransferase [Eubacteriales bacterium]|nr:DUF6036 family nucleotidyltransferase [Eubacteriales bacterium]
MLDMLREDLLERLNRLDEDASLMFDGNERFHLVIVGGAALILLEHISRATSDVDAISASCEILELLQKYDINCRVQTYINNFPYNYEDRLVPLHVGGRKIDFYSASLEDIVIAKLYSARAADIWDVENVEIVKAIDWKLLEKLASEADEARASALSDRCYANFKANYNDYVRRFRK